MSSFFKFLAQTSPDLKKYLIKELHLLGLAPVANSNINEIEFRANEEKLFEIMYKSRTVEGLKVQVGNDILARGEKEFEKNLKKLPWHAFINPDVLQSMDLPEVKCKSFRSNLYHEKKVSEIVSKFLNQLDLRKSLKEVRKLGFDKEIQELPEKTLKITKLIHHSRKKLSLQQELLEENLKNDSKNATTQINKELKTIEKNSDLTVEDNKEKKMSEYDNLRWPVLFVYLVNNKASLCLIMNKLSLHKHGYRKYISWGPIKESLISGCLFESNFIERSRSKKSLKLWDPFCGSGTILLEALSMYLGLPVRVNKDSETFDLKNIRIINKDAHTNYLEKLWNVHENVWLEQSDIFILGNDINSEAIKSSINNFSKLLEDQNFSETSPQLNLFKENPVLFQHSFLSNRIHVFLTDFENVPKITSIQGLSILTNPPYGYRSRKHISFNNLKGLYLRFRTLLRKNARNLDEIYVLYPMDQKNAGSLIKMPGLAWNLVEKFENGGIEIGLFQLNKDKTLDMKNKDFHEITIINERIQMEVAKIEENKALIAFKKDPEEKDKRKQEKYKEEKNLLIEARKRTKNLKFPRVVTRDKQKLRRILHAKHEDFIQKSRRKKYIEGKKEIIQKIKAQKAQKSHDVRKKKGLDVINSLIDQENAKVSEEVTKNLQLELNKRANKNLKMRNETMKSAIKKPRSSKW